MVIGQIITHKKIFNVNVGSIEIQYKFRHQVLFSDNLSSKEKDYEDYREDNGDEDQSESSEDEEFLYVEESTDVIRRTTRPNIGQPQRRFHDFYFYSAQHFRT